ncbi:anaerobic ribonucleoside-triphosphate reductase activating protein [Paenibacillus agilis]|uniref:anaerobic ribonucleoside-triphosphate reductase activating protein n=1 Tax=Paenibacillus agilis TaxID=3020863 RepID=UPI0021BD4415|nr:anaerobic ribonucleoside-triphosphate reductase activating protein [Paenibacillus agilis]
MSLRVLSFVHDSVVDGEGLRSVIFLSGCPHRCVGCHNPQSWNMQAGEVLSVEEAAAELLSNPLSDITLSGGEPFLQAREVKRLARILREAGRNIWAYTGYTLEYIKQSGTKDMNELLTYIDVLVDGQFLQERRRPELRFRGSDNQRIWKLSNGNPDGLFLV